MEKNWLPLLSKIHFFPRLARFLFENLVVPRSQSEDDRRQEFILNILLLASVTLACVCAAIVILNNSEIMARLIAISVLATFILLLVASRQGYFRASAHILVGVYTLPMLLMTVALGIDLPQILLSYALLIVMSSVLIGTRFSLLYTLGLSIFLSGLAYANLLGRWSPDQAWRAEPFIAYDVIAFVVTFGAIATVSWLSNREMEKSLIRARRSEAELKAERDSLEIKVKERTAELQRAQMEKLSQLQRFVEFGRLASGLFHDLASPLTAVALNLESLKDSSSPAGRARQHVEQAIRATKGLENFIAAARKQLQTQETKITFDTAKEIREVVSVLTHKAHKAGVEIQCRIEERMFIHGNPLKFHQIIANLLSNAIDAYQQPPTGTQPQPIVIASVDKVEFISITVTDGGSGIPEHYQTRIFEPFFTTKGIESGMGIGLSSVKNIVEKDFHGTISFTSIPGRGTSFTIRVPHPASQSTS